MNEPTFVVKVFRGGSHLASSVEFYYAVTPRVINLKHNDNDFDKALHESQIKKGATHAIELTVNFTRVNSTGTDYIYIYERDFMFIETFAGETVYGIKPK